MSMIEVATVAVDIPYWNDHQPAGGYDSTRMAKGPDGHYYRQDCSGYLSMLLKLHDNPYTGAMVGDTYTVPIDRDRLRFGDALIALPGGTWSEGHCVLFDHWTGDDTYLGHEWGWGVAPAHREITWPYTDPGGGQDTRTFRCYRFKVLDAPPPPVPGRIVYGPYYKGRTASRTLVKGCRGDDVRSFQRTWNKWYPHETQLDPDGFYGPLSAGAAGYYQKRAGIKVTDQVDRATWRGLGYALHYSG